jgi:hypothetical protein
MATRCFCPPDKLVDLFAAEPRQSHPIQDIRHLAINIGLFLLFPLEAESDVLGHVHHRKKGQVLKDQVHRPAVGREVRHVLAADENPPFGRFDKAGDHSQQRGFPTAGRT